MKHLLLLAAFAVTILTGCRPYNTPDLATIQPNETAFILPLDSDTENQEKFESVEFLKEKQVAAKRIEVTRRWRQTGYFPIQGEYIPEFRVIKVDRSPATKNWKDIQAESRESIGFSVELTVVAQIPEDKAAVYLYNYREKALSEVMDQEMRSRINGKFVEYCSGLNLTDIFSKKAEIMANVRSFVVPYFEARGIEVTNLEMQGNLDFESDDIQASIDKVFAAAQQVKAQKDQNQAAQLKAENDRRIAGLLSGDTAIKLKELELRAKELEIQGEIAKKWNGQLPTYSGSQSGLFGMLQGMSK